MGRFLRRPLLIVSVTICLLAGAYIAYRASRPTSYELYERINAGDRFADVSRRIGQPIASNETTNGTDYLFRVHGHPDYPSMLGAPFPVHRIVRVQSGRVISKGAYEHYYDPYSPGWAPKKEGASK